MVSYGEVRRRPGRGGAVYPGPEVRPLGEHVAEGRGGTRTAAGEWVCVRRSTPGLVQVTVRVVPV